MPRKPLVGKHLQRVNVKEWLPPTVLKTSCFGNLQRTGLIRCHDEATAAQMADLLFPLRAD